MVESEAQRAVRRRHARRRHLRPCRLPAGDRRRSSNWPSVPRRSPGRCRSRRAEEQALAARSTRWPAPRSPRPITSSDKQVRHEQGRRRQEGRARGAGRRGRWTPRRPRAPFKELEADIVRNAILDTGLRIDGRDTKTVRPIVAEVGVLPRAHGSALFTRGETQALCVATLGTGQDEQIIDALEGEYREHFMLHYNFPPYSVGEAGRMGSPGRREIGHGKLAWRAIHPLLPAKDKFPYTLRVVSRDHREQRLLLDGDGVRLVAGADGRRRAAEAPGGRHRHGPDQGGPRLRRAVRHPRRRGPSRRHGLQGRRHRARRDLPCRWTSRSRPSRRRSCRSRWIRRRTGGCTSWARWRKAHHRARGRRGGHGAAHHHHQRAEGEDPRSDRHRRQGDPRDRRADRLQDRHRGRRHHQDRRHRPGPRRRRRSTGSAASWRNRRSA